MVSAHGTRSLQIAPRFLVSSPSIANSLFELISGILANHRSTTMSSLYDQSIPVLAKYLQGFSAMMDKAAAYADEKGISHDTAIADDEMTIAQLQARVDRTIKYATSANAAELSNEPIPMLDRFYFGSAQTYLSEFAIPNFHFHLSTGYCILRTQAWVPLDAMDYLSNVFKSWPTPGPVTIPNNDVALHISQPSHPFQYHVW